MFLGSRLCIISEKHQPRNSAVIEEGTFRQRRGAAQRRICESGNAETGVKMNRRPTLIPQQ
jgi:hypothetical protein